MYINRPVVDGKDRGNRKINHKNQQTVKSKNIRVKTLPSTQTLSKVRPQASQKMKSISIEEKVKGEVIGNKEVKELLDVQLRDMLESIFCLQREICQEEKQSYHQKVKNYDNSNDNQDDGVYDQCLAFINECFTRSQREHTGNLKKYRIKLFEYEQTLQQLQLERQVVSTKIKEIKKILIRQEKDMKLLQKRKTVRQDLQEAIQQEKNFIGQKQRQLFYFKQQSIQQKSAYIELQAEEVKLNHLIQEARDNNQRQYQSHQRETYFKQTNSLKQKLIQMLKQQNSQMKKLLQQKIQAISKTRARVDDLQEKTYQVQENIEQQISVINLLIDKCQKADIQEREEAAPEWRAYREKYEKIFFPKVSVVVQGSSNNVWQNYRDYLDQLLQSAQKSQSGQSAMLSPSRSRKNKFQMTKNSEKHSWKYVDKQGWGSSKKQVQKVSLSNSFCHQSKNEEKFSRKEEQTGPHSQILGQNRIESRTGMILPKLIKMQGKKSDQDKIKGQLAKFTQANIDDDVSLVTVNSNDTGGQDGDIIEVEFKGTNDLKKEKN